MINFKKHSTKWFIVLPLPVFVQRAFAESLLFGLTIVDLRIVELVVMQVGDSEFIFIQIIVQVQIGLRAYFLVAKLFFVFVLFLLESTQIVFPLILVILIRILILIRIVVTLFVVTFDIEITVYIGFNSIIGIQFLSTLLILFIPIIIIIQISVCHRNCINIIIESIRNIFKWPLVWMRIK